jgi:hypothetical protein
MRSTKSRFYVCEQDVASKIAVERIFGATAQIMLAGCAWMFKQHDGPDPNQPDKAFVSRHISRVGGLVWDCDS